MKNGMMYGNIKFHDIILLLPYLCHSSRFQCCKLVFILFYICVCECERIRGLFMHDVGK